MKKKIVKIVAAIAFIALAFGNILVVSNNGSNDISLENVKANAFDPIEPPGGGGNGKFGYCLYFPRTGVYIECSGEGAICIDDYSCYGGFC